MDTEKIVERFALLSSLTLEEASTFTYICNDAKNEIISKLLPDTDLTLHSERLIAAAAALSLYRYMQLKALNQTTESFSAGDITVKENMNQAVKIAFDIWLNEKAKIADLLLQDLQCLWKEPLHPAPD